MFKCFCFFFGAMSNETLVGGINLASQPVHQLLAAKMEPDQEEQELLKQIQEWLQV